MQLVSALTGAGLSLCCGGGFVASVRFTVHGVAQPAGSKRGFRNPKTGGIIITDANAKSRPWKALVTDAAVQAMEGRELFDEPLILCLEFYMVRHKGHVGKRGLRPTAPEVPTV